MTASSWVKSAFARSSRRRRLLEYAGAAVASSVAAWRFLHLWAADLRVPFNYTGDALAFGMLVKSIVDHGWYLTNPHLGAPGVLETHDFPFPDIIHLLVFKVMSWFTSDWALIFNVYFLLGFPLITLSSLAVLRHFRVAYGPALAVSLLYAFLPSRLLKGEHHYFLDIFYQVPLAILVALWVSGDDPPLGFGRAASSGGGGDDRRARRVRGAVAVGICVLTAGTGLYYAFFSGVLITLGGIWASIRRRSARNLASGLALTAIIVAGLGVQGIPTWLHDRREGANHVAARAHSDSEVFGMRVAQLLLPVPGHRVPALRDLRERYDASAPFYGESSLTALGVVASVGFLTLLGLMLLGSRSDRAREDLLRPLAVLNLIAVLLATIGGLGSLLALLVTAQIRTYSRMHVVIAFLSLFTVALLIERAGRRLGRWAPLLSVAVVVVGLFDQVTARAVRPYRDTKALYQQDAAFVRGIEAQLAPDAMVFELPYVTFPEASPLPGQRMGDYEMVRPYLHSHTVRWSHPAMLGRSDDAWIQMVSLRPPAHLVERLTDAGFGAILINRQGYADGAAEVEGAIARALGRPASVSGDGRLAFFPLAEHERQVFAGVSDAAREQRRSLALHPSVLRFASGCYQTEYERSGPFRWCSASGELEIDNDAALERIATLTMTAMASKPPATLVIEGDLWSATFEVRLGGTPLAHTMKIPPGHHRLRFRMDGRPADAPADSRRAHLIWRAENPRLEEAEIEDPP